MWDNRKHALEREIASFEQKSDVDQLTEILTKNPELLKTVEDVINASKHNK